jgi:hypothetical protein
MRRALVAAVMAFALLCPPAMANRGLELAAGEQFVGVPTGSFDHTDAGYWTERRDTRIYTPALWRTLARTHTRLALHLRYGRDFGPTPSGMPRIEDALPLLRAANRHGVPVTAWLVVPYADGYWAHERNAAPQATAVRSFVAWAREQRVHVEAVLLDLEASLQDTRTFGASGSDPMTTMQTLRANVGPAGQCAAIKSYAAIAGQIRAAGYDATTAAYPFLLDDVNDGNLALDDGLNAPVPLPGEFDEVGFMTMRSVYIGMTHIDPGPSLQASYQESIARWFPREGALDLGVAGAAPYDDLDTLLDDVRTAATVSDRPVGLYSLESTVSAFGLRGLRSVIAAAHHPYPTAPAVTPQARANRAYIRAEDAGVAAGTPPALASRGETPALPNAWPPRCG